MTNYTDMCYKNKYDIESAVIELYQVGYDEEDILEAICSDFGVTDEVSIDRYVWPVIQDTIAECKYNTDLIY